MRDEPSALPLRIIMEHPLPGIAVALQCGATGKAQLIGPVGAPSDALVFEFAVILDGKTKAGRPRLLGPFVQGPPEARFVYLNSGGLAHQPGSAWRRRAKVPLGGIDWALIEALGPETRLTARIEGRARDGGPACASVPLLPPGWRLE